MKFLWSSVLVNQEEAVLAQRKNAAAVIKYLKHINHTLPSFLLLGDSQAGKTSLLREAGIRFTKIIPTPPAEHAFMPSQSCTWLVSENSVYIDIAGRLIDNPEKKTLWLDLLRSLKRTQKISPLAGVILVLELPTFVTEPATYFLKYKQYLFELTQHLNKPCPLIIVFSKCDRIVGFTEFFSHLSVFERAQTWGCELTGKANVTEQFKQQYQQLILQLQQQLNQQLHYENNAELRNAIFAFPNQMGMLQSLITNTLYELCETTSYGEKLPLQGVYFTSAQQLASNQQSVDLLATQLRPSLGLANTRIINPNTEDAVLSYAYFIHELFNHYLINKANIKPLKPYWQKVGLAAGVTIIVVAGAALIGQFYQQQLHLLNAAQAELNRYQALTTLAADDSLMQKDAALLAHKAAINLQALAALSQANTELSKLKLTWLKFFNGDANIANLPNYTRQILQRALQQTFGPQLKSCLEHDLLTTGADPDKIYTQLKTYLMLAEPQHRQVAQMSKAITACWMGELNHLTASNHLAALPADLTTALAQSLPTTALNRAAITFARTQLQNLQPALLAYLVLKDQVMSNTALNLPLMQLLSTAPDTSGHALFMPRKINPIPNLYTAAGFQQVYSGQLQVAVQTAMNGNWVLGNKVKPLPDNLDKDLLLQQVSELYLNDYANWWDTSLAAFEIVKIKSLQQATAILKRLSETTGLLQQLMQMVAVNTSSQLLLERLPEQGSKLDANIRSQIQTIFDNRFQNLSMWSKNSEKNAEAIKEQLQNKLFNLYKFIETIAEDKNPQAAAVKATAAFLETANNAHPLADMLQHSKQMPMPLQRWLVDSTQGVWWVLADTTKKTLNMAWQTNILPLSKSLQNCYPLNKNASMDCHVGNFSHFFAPNGVLAQYFEQHLKAFVDTSTPDWHWRSKAGLQLPLADNVLPTFVRGRIISKMYFPANKNQMDVSFTLQPITFAQTISQFKLTLNNQSLQDQPGVDTITALHWPGKGSQDKTSFSFITTAANTDEITTALQGPWAWFRLLDQLQVIPTSNPKRYIVVFRNKDEYSKYQLLAKETVNPFISGIVDQFQCPESVG